MRLNIRSVPQIHFPTNPSLAPGVQSMSVIVNVGTVPTETVIDA